MGTEQASHRRRGLQIRAALGIVHNADPQSGQARCGIGCAGI
jgi:hypothetical protein